MKRSTKQWISLTALAAVLTVGCAARPPQAARPEANQNQVGSTTGDLDACAVALGNAVSPAGGAGAGAGTMGTPAAGAGAGTAGVGNRSAAGPIAVTANGVLIGNVALVALPATDDRPMTPPANPTPGAGAGAGAAAPAAPGAGAVGAGIAGAGRDLARGTVGAGGELAQGAAGAGRQLARGAEGAMERTGVPGGIAANPAPGTPGTTAPGTTGVGTPETSGTTAPGTTVTPGTATPAGGNDALTRIRTACRGVVQIKTVEKSPDRERLAEIAMSIRRGEPVTNFMADLVGIHDRATITANYAPQPGGAAPGATGPAGAPTPTGTPTGPAGAPTAP